MTLPLSHHRSKPLTEWLHCSALCVDPECKTQEVTTCRECPAETQMFTAANPSFSQVTDGKTEAQKTGVTRGFSAVTLANTNGSQAASLPPLEGKGP